MLHTLIIGINDYPGTGSDLAGCANDARNWQRVFGRRHRGAVRDKLDACPFFGSADSQRMLLDGQATRPACLSAIRSLLKLLMPRDLGVVVWSGHGTYVEDTSGDEPDRFDEALVCADGRAIIDDELGELFGRRMSGSRLLVITDSCHSGTATRSAGPRLLGQTGAGDDLGRDLRVRFLPPARLAANERSGWRTAPRRSPKLIDVIHLAACQDDQFAADAMFQRPEGAFSHYAIDALCSLEPGATYADWCLAISQRLPNAKYDQEPQVNAYARALSWKIPTRG